MEILQAENTDVVSRKQQYKTNKIISHIIKSKLFKNKKRDL